MFYHAPYGFRSKFHQCLEIQHAKVTVWDTGCLHGSISPFPLSSAISCDPGLGHGNVKLTETGRLECRRSTTRLSSDYTQGSSACRRFDWTRPSFDIDLRSWTLKLRAILGPGRDLQISETFKCRNWECGIIGNRSRCRGWWHQNWRKFGGAKYYCWGCKYAPKHRILLVRAWGHTTPIIVNTGLWLAAQNCQSCCHDSSNKLLLSIESSYNRASNKRSQSLLGAKSSRVRKGALQFQYHPKLSHRPLQHQLCGRSKNWRKGGIHKFSRRSGTLWGYGDIPGALRTLGTWPYIYPYSG